MLAIFFKNPTNIFVEKDGLHPPVGGWSPSPTYNCPPDLSGAAAFSSPD